MIVYYTQFGQLVHLAQYLTGNGFLKPWAENFFPLHCYLRDGDVITDTTI